LAPGLDRQRRACSGEPTTSDDQQRHVGAPDSELQPERERRGKTHDQLAEIQRDQREPGAANEHVDGAKRDVAATTAAHPQEPAQIDPGLRGRRWIERLLGVDEGGGLAALRDVAQTRDEKARAPRRRPAHDLGDLPASRNHALHTQKTNQVMSIRQA